MSEVKNVEVTEELTEVTAVVEETEKVGFLAKTGKFFSKHKKSLAIGAGVAAVAGVVVALLKAGSKTEEIYDIDDADFDAADLDTEEETE